MPRKKYKLKCFICNRIFNNKEYVWRDHNGFPVCEEHLEEDIYEEFDDDCIEYIKSDIKKLFNKNFKKYIEYMYKTCSVCEECNSWLPNEYFSEDEFKKSCKYCNDCKDKMKEE